MTTITIERELLERAAALLNPDRSPSALFHQRRDCAEAVRAALAAPATAPERPNPYDACESFKAYQLSCRREAVLQKEIERLLAAPATAPEQMPLERDCICHQDLHIDGYSGGAAPEGLYGALWVTSPAVEIVLDSTSAIVLIIGCGSSLYFGINGLPFRPSRVSPKWLIWSED